MPVVSVKKVVIKFKITINGKIKIFFKPSLLPFTKIQSFFYHWDFRRDCI